MAPLCGIIIVDYVYAKRGNLHIPSLYTSRPGSLYMYTHGVNYRGVFAWFGAVALALPGLVAAYRPELVDQAGKDMVSDISPLRAFQNLKCFFKIDKSLEDSLPKKQCFEDSVSAHESALENTIE